MENSSKKYKFAELRRQAEAIKAEGHSSGVQLSDEITELIHDLEVHHIELELQHTELERANELLEEARQEYTDLFDFAPIGYLVLGDESEIVKANLTSAALLRSDRTRLIGRNFSTFLVPKDKDLLYIHRRDLLNQRQPQRFTAEIKPTDGNTFFAQINMEPIKESETQCQVAITDISLMKAAEERLKQTVFREQQLNKLKENLINVISIEVPAPMNRALLITDLLLSDESVTDPGVIKHLKLIEHNIWYINNFIKDVLMAYQLNQIPFQASYETFDVIEFGRNIAQDMESQSEEKRLSFVSNTDSKVVMLDRNLMRRILISILNNATKYSDDEIEFRIHVDRTKMAIHVTDFGRGIPTDDQPYVFQLFYRGSNVTDIPGFGLGLSVVKSAVEALNGTVQINSTEHQRTTVTLRIPIQHEADSQHE